MRNQKVIAEIPAIHTDNSQKDKKCINILSYIFSHDGFIIDKLDWNDKRPSCDGFIEIIDKEKKFTIGKFEVQVKTLNKKDINSNISYNFADEGKFFKYVELNTGLPILLIGVDLNTENAYWKYMDGDIIKELNFNRVYFDSTNVIKKGDLNYYEKLLNIYKETRPKYIVNKFKNFVEDAESDLPNVQNVSTEILSLKFERFRDYLIFLDCFFDKKTFAKGTKIELMISISKNDFLTRHFLHNQENDSLFDDIQKNIVPVIIKDKESEDHERDGNNKWKLIEYLEKYGKNPADQTMVILLEMYQKAKTPNLKRKVALAIQNLGEIQNIDKIFELADLISKENDAMVRDFGLDGLIQFAEKFTLDQNKQIVQNLFFVPIEEQDVVQHNATMALKFQAKDLADASFRGSASYLGKLLQLPQFSQEVLPIFMQIYDTFLSKEVYEQKDGIKIKEHSTWWMEREDFSGDRWKYESDPKKRLSLELLNALKELENKNPDIFEIICSTIITKAEYIGYFEILLQVINNHLHSEIIEKIVMNSDLLIALELDKKRRYDLYHIYFTQHKEKISHYIQLVESVKIKDNKKLEDRVKSKAYFVLPEPRDQKVQEFINGYEEDVKKEHNLESWKMSVEEENDFTLKSFRDDYHLDLARLDQQRTTQELIDKLTELESKNTMFAYNRDVYNKYANYLISYPDQLVEFYTQLKQQNPEYIKDGFVGCIVEAQIAECKKDDKDKNSFYSKILELYDIFKDDTDAKILFARVFDEYLRDKDTAEMKSKNPDFFGKIKGFILALAQDRDPDKQEGDHETAYVELNSVRGVAVRLVAILAHYYPEEKDIYDTLELLSKDDFMEIRSTVIENLVYLITKDYSFCERIIKANEDQENPRINQALIRYMFRLGNEKLKAKEDLMRKISTIQDKNIQSNLGDLLGQAFIYDVALDQIVEDMIVGKIGTSDMVQNFALQLENWIPKILFSIDGAINKEKILDVYNRLLKDYKNQDKQEEWSIKDRLSFLFYDEQLKPDFFDIFAENSVFDVFIEYGPSNVQNHLNKYLLKCVEADQKYYDKVLMLLTSQIEKHKSILFSESYLCEEVVKIIKEILSKRGRNEILDKIFDEGLKYGSTGFYDIFNEYYRQAS